MRKTIQTIFLLFILMPVLNAQDTLTIDKAIALALERNYNIKIAKVNQQKATNNNAWGQTGVLPTIEARFRGNRSYNADTLTITSQTYGPEASVNWVIFNGLNAITTKKQLELLQEQSDIRADLIIENTVQGVMLAYYNVLLQQDRLSVLRQVMALSKDRYQQLQVRKDLGTAVSFELLQSKTVYLSDSAEVIQQINQIKQAKRNLNLLLAYEVNQEHIYNDTLDFAFPEVNYRQLEENMLADNKNLNNQFINKAIAENSIRIARSAYYPTLNLQGSAGKSYGYREFENFPQQDVENLQFFVGFTLSYTLFNGGQRYRRYKNTKLDIRISELETNQLKDELLVDLRNYYDDYLSQLQTVHVLEQTVEAAQLNLLQAQEKYDLGVINSFNFRDIQLNYLNSSWQLLQSKYRALSQYLELQRLSGQIVAETNH